MSKDTRLKDTASIYEHRKDKESDKQKLKNMTKKEKWQFFNDYYRNKFIIGFLILALIIYLIYTAIVPGAKTVFYATIINDPIDIEQELALTADFSKYLKLDPEKQIAFFDTTMSLSDTNPTEATMSSEQKLITYLASGSIDIIIADKATFHKYASNGYFYNLADQLPTYLYSELTDDFFIDSTKTSSEEAAYGINLSNCAKYKALGGTLKDPVLGIALNSNFNSNAVNFIHYLFEIDPH